MLHKFLTIGLPLILPCLVYFTYAHFARKRAMAFIMGEDGEIHHETFTSLSKPSELLGRQGEKSIRSPLGRQN